MHEIMGAYEVDAEGNVIGDPIIGTDFDAYKERITELTGGI